MKSRRKTPSLIQSENSEKLEDRFVKPRTSWKRKHETTDRHVLKFMVPQKVTKDLALMVCGSH